MPHLDRCWTYLFMVSARLHYNLLFLLVLFHLLFHSFRFLFCLIHLFFRSFTYPLFIFIYWFSEFVAHFYRRLEICYFRRIRLICFFLSHILYKRLQVFCLYLCFIVIIIIIKMSKTLNQKKCCFRMELKTKKLVFIILLLVLASRLFIIWFVDTFWKEIAYFEKKFALSTKFCNQWTGFSYFSFFFFGGFTTGYAFYETLK